MKINSLLESQTVSSAISNTTTSAPVFGRDEDKLEETMTSGCVSSVANPVGKVRSRGSIFSGINTSEKFPNSKEVEEATFNRGGHNPLKSKEDYLDKREHLHKQLNTPGLNKDDRDVIRQRLQDLESVARKQGLAESSLEEYGDTKKGQKMLTKVQKRAVDRMIKADDKRDAKNAKKNQDTANRAWDRMDDKDLEEARANTAGARAGLSKRKETKPLSAEEQAAKDKAKSDKWLEKERAKTAAKKGVSEGYETTPFGSVNVQRPQMPAVPQQDREAQDQARERQARINDFREKKQDLLQQFAQLGTLRTEMIYGLENNVFLNKEQLIDFFKQQIDDPSLTALEYAYENDIPTDGLIKNILRRATQLGISMLDVRKMFNQAKQKLGENIGRKVDAKGLTQSEWMQAVKQKFPDAKIVQAKMIDGPAHALLSDGRKIVWSPVQGMTEGNDTAEDYRAKAQWLMRTHHLRPDEAMEYAYYDTDPDTWVGSPWEDDYKQGVAEEQINEINPHDFDSDEDYQNAVRKSKQKYHDDDDFDMTDDDDFDPMDDESYYEKYVRTKRLEEEQVDENLRDWFKEKWVRFGPDGKIRGSCARGDDSEGKPKCLPQAKAHSLGKKGRASAAARKRREDPNPERSGKAINVNTKKKSNEGMSEGSLAEMDKSAPQPGRDGRVSHSTYGSRDKGGSKGPEKEAKPITAKKAKQDALDILKKQGVAEAELDEACWKGYHKEGNKKMFGKTYPNCVKNTNEEQLDEKCWDTHKQVGMKNKGGKMVPNCVPKESVEEVSEQWTKLPNGNYRNMHTGVQQSKPPVKKKRGEKTGAEWDAIEKAKKDKEQGVAEEKCPHCGGAMFSEMIMNEKKDACYYKVKSRYKVWPSAYASGALVKCRKKGASNWGTGGKKNESMNEAEISEEMLAHELYKDLQIFKQGKDKTIGKKSKSKDISKKPEDRDIVVKEGTDMKLKEVIVEAANPAQQAAIAIAMKGKGQKPKNENAEYDDEAGMADNNLETLERAVQGIDELINSGDNLPEWCQEKIAVSKSMLVTVWDYMKSEEDRGALAEEFDLIESIVEGIAVRNNVNSEAIWEDLESLTDDELYVFAVTSEPINEDWQKVNKKDKTDGMSPKAVKAYRRENPGSKLKTAVTTKPSKLKKGSKASKRRKSYCSRSRGQMKMHNISCSKTPDKAICKARRRWNC